MINILNAGVALIKKNKFFFQFFCTEERENVKKFSKFQHLKSNILT
jgi:hypothetical protein